MIKEKVNRNEYMKIQKNLADEYMKKCIAINNVSTEEIKELKGIYYKEFEDELEKFEVLDFNLNLEDKELIRFLNNNFDYEEKVDGHVRFTGNGSQELIYNFAGRNGYSMIHNDCYCCSYYSKESMSILTYCEGDIICEVFESEDIFLLELDKTVDFYKNEY